MKLVPPDWVSEDERDVQRLFGEHPRVAQQITWLVNCYRETLKLCMEAMQEEHVDTADIARSCLKHENAMWRMGIPRLETAVDWMELREQMTKE